jgi:hypothetical protein
MPLTTPVTGSQEEREKVTKGSFPLSELPNTSNRLPATAISLMLERMKRLERPAGAQYHADHSEEARQAHQKVR